MSVKKQTLLLLSLLALPLTLLFADKTGFLADPSWPQKIRRDHPRLIFTAEDIPLLRERAAGVNSREFAELKRYADKLPEKAKKQLRENLVTLHADGTFTPNSASASATGLYVHNGSDQAVRLALLYLLTGERHYAEQAYDYLKMAIDILEETAANNIWAGWMGNFRINVIFAYDWIYNELTPEQREQIIRPLMAYTVKAQPDGEFKFRRAMGDYTTGNYGELGMRYYLGLAAYGDGIDDALAEQLLRGGTEHFVKMMDFRDEASANSGLVSTITTSYSLSPYPYATFFFLHCWQSATGEDIATRWTHMINFPRWFDYSAIGFDQNRRFLTYGLGDVAHTDNYQAIGAAYLHLAQAIHFYQKHFPQKMENAYATLKRLPKSARNMGNIYPFLPFRLDQFDESRIDLTTADHADPGAYFYNSTFGLLLMRSGTDEDDTYASFRFGSRHTTHQHYDELSFIVYKRGFLALDGGSRSMSTHHHMYAPQTVAHNSILIHQEKEPMPPFWRNWGVKDDGKTYYNHGGQNERTKTVPLALQSTDAFIYAAGDATEAYAASKSKQVVRQFVYILPDIFVVFDRVESVKAGQKKEVLFQLQNKPEQIAKAQWREDNGGVLFINTLLPQNAHTHLEGGTGREFWASGRNWELPGGENWEEEFKLTGKWRLEVSTAGKPTAKAEFLHVLKAALPENVSNVTAQTELTPQIATVRFKDERGTNWELRFNREGDTGLHIRQVSATGAVLFDAPLPQKIEANAEEGGGGTQPAAH